MSWVRGRKWTHYCHIILGKRFASVDRIAGELPVLISGSVAIRVCLIFRDGLSHDAIHLILKITNQFCHTFIGQLWLPSWEDWYQIWWLKMLDQRIKWKPGMPISNHLSIAMILLLHFLAMHIFSIVFQHTCEWKALYHCVIVKAVGNFPISWLFIRPWLIHEDFENYAACDHVVKALIPFSHPIP